MADNTQTRGYAVLSFSSLPRWFEHPLRRQQFDDYIGQMRVVVRAPDPHIQPRKKAGDIDRNP